MPGRVVQINISKGGVPKWLLIQIIVLSAILNAYNNPNGAGAVGQSFVDGMKSAVFALASSPLVLCTAGLR